MATSKTTKPAGKRQTSKPATKRKPAARKPRKPAEPDFAKTLGREDLGPAELAWLKQQQNQPVPEKDLPFNVGLGSHNPLQGRPF